MKLKTLCLSKSLIAIISPSCIPNFSNPIDTIFLYPASFKIFSISFEKFGIHDGDIIAISNLDRQRVFNFIVKNDIIYIKNRTTGQTLFEKFISSYQEPFSFTINK